MLGNTIPEEGEPHIPVITYETPTLDRGRSPKESSPPLTRTMSPDVPRIPLGGRRRSFVPTPIAPPVDPGSETAAYVQRLEDERNSVCILGWFVWQNVWLTNCFVALYAVARTIERCTRC